MPKGISIEQFCSRNKVPYNIFYKWYKDTRNKIVEVKVDGVTTSAQGESKQEQASTVTKSFCIRMPIEQRMQIDSISLFIFLALNYLDKFWDNIFAFLKDGDLPIDNNLAERTIRPLTTQRNAMLHFGSDEGVEMAATYHSIISTVKMQGKSAWEYLGKFFTKIFNGCKDFISLRPDKIGLAICQ